MSQAQPRGGMGWGQGERLAAVGESGGGDTDRGEAVRMQRGGRPGKGLMSSFMSFSCSALSELFFLFGPASASRLRKGMTELGLGQQAV